MLEHNTKKAEEKAKNEASKQYTFYFNPKDKIYDIEQACIYNCIVYIFYNSSILNLKKNLYEQISSKKIDDISMYIKLKTSDEGARTIQELLGPTLYYDPTSNTINQLWKNNPKINKFFKDLPYEYIEEEIKDKQFIDIQKYNTLSEEFKTLKTQNKSKVYNLLEKKPIFGSFPPKKENIGIDISKINTDFKTNYDSAIIFNTNNGKIEHVFDKYVSDIPNNNVIDIKYIEELYTVNKNIKDKIGAYIYNFKETNSSSSSNRTLELYDLSKDINNDLYKKMFYIYLITRL